MEFLFFEVVWRVEGVWGVESIWEWGGVVVGRLEVTG